MAQLWYLRLPVSSLALDQEMNDRNIEHKTMYPGGGHTWMNCRDYLIEVAKLLFK